MVCLLSCWTPEERFPAAADDDEVETTPAPFGPTGVGAGWPESASSRPPPRRGEEAAEEEAAREPVVRAARSASERAKPEAHYGTKPGHCKTSKIHFPASEGVSEVSAAEGASQASSPEQATE